MDNHLTATAPACAHSIPHVYTAATVRTYLHATSVRYRARPVYNGHAIIVTITRIVMPITAITARHGLDLAQDATSSLIKANIMDDQEPVRFKRLIWIPLHRGRYRPSLSVPYKADRCSEEDACNGMQKVHRRDFRDLCYVDYLSRIDWT